MNTMLDVDGTMKRLGNDLELFRDMVTIFEEDAPVLLSMLRAAAERGDSVVVQQHAHALKGLAQNLGATSIAAVAREVEESARAGETHLAPMACFRLEGCLRSLGPILALYRRGTTASSGQ